MSFLVFTYTKPNIISADFPCIKSSGLDCAILAIVQFPRILNLGHNSEARDAERSEAIPWIYVIVDRLHIPIALSLYILATKLNTYTARPVCWREWIS